MYIMTVTCDCPYKTTDINLPIWQQVHPSQCGLACNGANYGWDGKLRTITQKRIWNTVRVPSSLYLSELASLTVAGRSSLGFKNINWNQMSDQPTASFQNYNVPSRGNSTKTTLTRNRPGASTPGGLGVDVKHGSYARYLAKKKAGNMGTRPMGSTPGFNSSLNSVLRFNNSITNGYKIGTFGISSLSRCC